MSSQPFPLLPPIQPQASGTSGTNDLDALNELGVDVIRRELGRQTRRQLNRRELAQEEAAFGPMVARQPLPVGGGSLTIIANTAAQIRQAFFRAATPEKMHELAKAVIGKAIDGNMVAAKLALEYTLGKAVSFDFVEDLAVLKEMMEQFNRDRR